MSYPFGTLVTFYKNGSYVKPGGSPAEPIDDAIQHKISR